MNYETGGNAGGRGNGRLETDVRKKTLINETCVSQMLKSFNTAEHHVRSSSVCTLWGHFRNAANLYNETDISVMKIDCGLMRCNTALSCR